MATSEELRDISAKITDVANKKDKIKEAEDDIEEATGGEIKLSFLSNGHVLSEIEEIHKISTKLNINATDARKQLTFLKNITLMDKLFLTS